MSYAQKIPNAYLPDYAELHCLSNFSFLRGASQPGELVERAAQLGYAALAITDECSLAGVVRAHEEAKKRGLHLLIGSEFVLDHTLDKKGNEIFFDDGLKRGLKLVLLAINRNGYGNLSELITLARRRSAKGEYCLVRDDFQADSEVSHLAGMPDCLVIMIAAYDASLDQLRDDARWLAKTFPQRCWLAVELLHGMNDDLLLKTLQVIGAETGVPLVASGDVHIHVRSRKPIQDTLTAIRVSRPLSECGFALQVNAERHLRTRLRLAQLYPPELLAESVALAARCTFSLDELRYEYPDEVVPPGETHASYLRRMVEEGCVFRYPNGMPPEVHKQIEYELVLIADLHYEPYFLTVFDIVRFARARGILCQGRGSAANSAVCYCLGITEVDPARSTLLFERFISRERHEPPDIDVDFEHQRREEVIQYIYQRYGRDRTALTATVISYRSRSAMRDVGKVLGIDQQRLDRLSASHAWWDGKRVHPERLTENGFDPESPIVLRLVELTAALIGFPRHLSQHVGGFVIARERLSRLVPIENAAMPERSVIQWDKDDLEALGLMKVDVLALGMLSAIRRTLELVALRRGHPFIMQDIPDKDTDTYDMICRADTVGVFQIESRAQMSMLPRLRPRNFYDLVIEVAIVRPGPIQGGMVHPYLKRRKLKPEEVEYPSAALRRVLKRTLGVPIFQEQVMQIAMVAADFTPGEADQLRRSMAAWKRKGGLEPFRDKLTKGMMANGYAQEFAEQIFRQIQGFGEYGFPESHAASFALLVYDSAWLKCHEPAAFLCAMLNSLPLGFYSAAQLIQDGQRHGVRVHPVDVMVSRIESTLENIHSESPVVRLGFNRVRGLNAAAARRIVAARDGSGIKDNGGHNILPQPFGDMDDLARRANLNTGELQALAAADALLELAGHRRNARWAVAGLAPPGEGKAERAAETRSTKRPGHNADLLRATSIHEVQPDLMPAREGQEIVADYASMGLSLRRHPLALLRPLLTRMRLVRAAELQMYPHGRLARTCGMVTVRQRPGTAKGVVFVTLEDESGTTNVIVWNRLVEAQRRELLGASLLTVYGVWQREGEVVHLIAKRLVDHSHLLGELVVESRDFH